MTCSPSDLPTSIHRTTALALVVVGMATIPPVATAQTAASPARVPAIIQTDAAAAAAASTASDRSGAHAWAAATSGFGAAASGPPGGVAGVPAAMPPPIRLLSPSAALNAKESQAVALARRWANRNEMPQPGEDGVIRFLYGATMPTVVCAPLQVCDLALQPGEVVNNVNIGDKVRWNISPGLSGGAAGETTHLIIKPTDSGLMSSMTIETNRRTYAVKLVSTQTQWMPLVAFNYPDDMQREWSAYQQNVAFGTAATTLPTGEKTDNLDFGFRLTGDSPMWRPLRVYTDGAKTYIQFPGTMAFGSAPALVGLDDDGGWFSSPTQQMVNYRIAGDRYVVDRVLDRAELVSGVGDSQARVRITREPAR